MYNLPIPEDPIMTDETTPLGSIHVSPRAIASIAYHAALQSYGVVGLASKNLMDGLAHVLVKDPTKGVEVQYDGQSITIEYPKGAEPPPKAIFDGERESSAKSLHPFTWDEGRPGFR